MNRRGQPQEEMELEPENNENWIDDEVDTEDEDELEGAERAERSERVHSAQSVMHAGAEELLAGAGTAESTVECPFCGEPISIVVDLSQESQSYIEDCSVCCRPIQFDVHCEDGELSSVEAGRG